jgi:hypothetical protein
VRRERAHKTVVHYATLLHDEYIINVSCFLWMFYSYTFLYNRMQEKVANENGEGRRHPGKGMKCHYEQSDKVTSISTDISFCPRKQNI